MVGYILHPSNWKEKYFISELLQNVVCACVSVLQEGFADLTT